jgi:urease accessory protein
MSPNQSTHPDWLLWQLADSAFPTGGFTHSGGLEAAWQQGEICNRVALGSFIETSLHQIGRAALPFLNAAHLEPERSDELDSFCDAFLANHVANRASRSQGRALLTAAQKVFQLAPWRDQQASKAAGEEMFENERPASFPAFAHLAPIFGLVTRKLDLPHAGAVRLFVFGHLRSLVASAVRLNIVGPMEGQAIQFRCSSQAEAAVARGVLLTLDDVAQTAPLLDLWQGAQDRLYSRLFQS